MNIEAYNTAQEGLSKIRSAIVTLLCSGEQKMTNADISRSLGLHAGYGGRHQGHITREVLEGMKTDGVVAQDTSSKKWSLRTNTNI